MIRFLNILLKLLEYHLLREHFATSKKNYLYTTRFFLIFQIIICSITIIISIINKTIPQAILLVFFSILLMNLFFILIIKNSEKDREETETKLKEYQILLDETNKFLNSNLNANILLTLVFTIIICILPFIVSIAGIKNNKSIFIVSLIFIPVIYIAISSLLLIRFKNENKQRLLSIDSIKKRKFLAISGNIFRNKIKFKINNLLNKYIKNKIISIFYKENIIIIWSIALGLITSIIITVKFELSIVFVLLFTQISGCIFSKKIFLKFNRYGRESQRPFIFAQFIFMIFIILGFLSPIKTSPVIAENSILFNLKGMILPITTLIDSFLMIFNNIIHSKNILLTLVPIPLFTVFYLISFTANKVMHIFEDYSDKKLKIELNREQQALIFGDNLSFYPFTLRAIISGFALLILYIEVPFISNLIFTLVNTLQVSEVFKIDILTESNIKAFFSIIFYISLIYILYISLIDLIGSMFSHIMLFSNEVVFVKNLFITRDITRIPIARINHIIVKQNIIERFLDIGTLIIETSDRGLVLAIKGVTSVSDKNRKIMDKVKFGL